MPEDTEDNQIEIPLQNSGYIFYPLMILGRGQCGTVYKGKNLLTNEIVAIKHIAINSNNSASILQREIALLRDKELQSSPYIISCHDVIIFEKNYYIITELCDCTLSDYVKNNRLDQNEVISIIHNIIQGYLILHRNNIIHRDLKPANILMKDKIPKIADFGSAKENTVTQTEDVGTLIFKAPEVLIGDSDYDDLIDIWSLGVTLYFIIYKVYPFKPSGFSQFAMLQEIKKSNGNFIKREGSFSEQVYDLLSRMLEVDKTKRIKWSEIEHHPVFDIFKLKKTMLTTSQINLSINPDQKRLISKQSDLEIQIANSQYVFYPFKLLGRGRYGTVFKGFNKKKLKEVAVKTMTLDKDIQINFQKQLIILKDSEIHRNKNILRWYDVIIKDKNCYVITELCEMALRDLIRLHYFTEEEILKIIYDISMGYLALKDKNLTNCRLCPESIFINEGIAKISDFYAFKSLHNDDNAYLAYLAPETLEDPSIVDDISDMWSLGITVYYMTFRELPFKPNQSGSKNLMLAEIKKGYEKLFKLKNSSLKIVELLKRMLDLNRNERIKWVDLSRIALSEKKSLSINQIGKGTNIEELKNCKNTNSTKTSQLKLEKLDDPLIDDMYSLNKTQPVHMVRHNSAFSKSTYLISPINKIQKMEDLTDDKIITIDMTKKEHNRQSKPAALKIRPHTIYIPGSFGENYTQGYLPVLVDGSNRPNMTKSFLNLSNHSKSISINSKKIIPNEKINLNSFVLSMSMSKK